jgi:hypothetical protein
MEDYHTIITVLSIIILLESLYIFSKKMKSSRSRRRRGAEGFSPIHDDMGQGHAWDSQDYATLGM